MGGPKESEENLGGSKECLSISQFHFNLFITMFTIHCKSAINEKAPENENNAIVTAEIVYLHIY